MTAGLARKNRALLFRLYLTLAIGLVAVAALLDFGFRELQARLHPASDPWQQGSLELIAEELAASPAGERAATAAALTRTFGVPVQVLEAEDIAGSRLGVGEARALSDVDGSTTWLKRASESNVIARVGPVAAPGDNPWLGLVPPLFYLSIFVLVGLWLRPLLKDLDTITASTRSFAADYREPRPTAPLVTNLRELAENFDAMSERLSALIQGQKELTSALSHEMRTPLARIRFALAMVADSKRPADPDELTAIGADVQELESLVTTMLDYARLDHPDTRMDWQQVPAEPWLRQTVEKCRLPGVDVAIRSGGCQELAMDPRLMTLALSNLLVNACRHARRKVEVSLGRGDGHYRLQVQDDGGGIPEADRARVFKAFTRLDDSRSRDSGGSGLGLAIVARIAGLHGGGAWAERSVPLGGACLTIAWPPPAERGCAAATEP